MTDRPGSSLAGIGLVLLATLCFAWMDALNKILGATYAVAQIMWVRFVVFAMLAAVLAGGRNLLTHLRSGRPRLQLVRCLVLLVEMGMVIEALRTVPIADLHALPAITPLIVTALSVPMLGERVGLRRWLAVGAAFLGVLVIVRPGLIEVSRGALIALASAVLFAVYVILTRKVADHDGARTSTLHLAITGAVVLSFIGPFHWRAPDAGGWALLVLLAVMGSLGHFLLIRDLQLTPASVVQPFTYVAIVWATGVGWLVFGDLPDLPTVTGAAIVVASGLYAFHRERLQPAAAGLGTARVPGAP
jgi:drug/metabolite transporter (DMT)-like permease